MSPERESGRDVTESCFYVLSLFVCCFVLYLMKSRVRPMGHEDLFLLAGVVNCVASVEGRSQYLCKMVDESGERRCSLRLWCRMSMQSLPGART